jgi:hypothetical protein
MLMACSMRLSELHLGNLFSVGTWTVSLSRALISTLCYMALQAHPRTACLAIDLAYGSYGLRKIQTRLLLFVIYFRLVGLRLNMPVPFQSLLFPLLDVSELGFHRGCANPEQ